MGFTQGLSGLNAAARNLTTIGNNIANSQTVGYKSGRTEFADMYAGSIGLGVKVSDVSRNFTGGAINTTGRDLDLAINGEGFFRLSQGEKAVYSRNGQFHRTKEGYIANAQGALLTGYNVSGFNSGSPTINTNGTPGIIKLPTVGMNAHATTNMDMVLDLDSTTSVVGIPATPADWANDAQWTSNFNVYDSLGNPHNVLLQFVRTSMAPTGSQWRVRAVATPGTITTGGQFDLNFDTNGNLTTAMPIAGMVLGTANGSDDITFDLNLSGSTQTNQDFRASGLLQDGYTSGDLVDIAIEGNGVVSGVYSNGQTVDLAQFKLARFASLQGLEPLGDNAWSETGASGQAVLGIAGTGQFGTLRGGALEKSNVDLSKQLVKMIIAQRTYQANAKTITTQSQIMQTAVNLAR